MDETASCFLINARKLAEMNVPMQSVVYNRILYAVMDEARPDTAVVMNETVKECMDRQSNRILGKFDPDGYLIRT